MENIGKEEFDSKMLFMPVSDLGQTLQHIESIDLEADDSAVLITSVCIKKRVGVNLARHFSVVIIDMPSFKKASNTIMSEHADKEEILVISDPQDLDKIPERKFSVKRTSIKSIQLSRKSSKNIYSDQGKEASTDMNSDSSSASDILK